MYGHVDTRAGFLKALEVFAFSKFGIISVFVCNSAMENPLVTAIADIRSFIEMVEAFLFKVRTGLVAGRAESTLNAVKKAFSICICLFAMIAVYTKVFGIINGIFVIPAGQSESFRFFRNHSRILTGEACNIFQRSIFGQLILEVDTIIQS